MAPEKLLGSIQSQAIMPEPIEIPIVTNHIKTINGYLCPGLQTTYVTINCVKGFTIIKNWSCFKKSEAHDKQQNTSNNDYSCFDFPG